MTYHIMNLSDIDFNDSIRIITCHDCGRSLSVKADENGHLDWQTLKVIGQGDFNALHKFGSTGLELSVEAYGDDR